MPRTHIHLTEQQLKQIKEEVERTGLKQSEVVRRIIDKGLIPETSMRDVYEEWKKDRGKQVVELQWFGINEKLYKVVTVLADNENGPDSFKLTWIFDKDEVVGDWIQFKTGELEGTVPRRIIANNHVTGTIYLDSGFPVTPSPGSEAIIIKRRERGEL